MYGSFRFGGIFLFALLLFGAFGFTSSIFGPLRRAVEPWCIPTFLSTHLTSEYHHIQPQPSCQFLGPFKFLLGAGNKVNSYAGLYLHPGTAITSLEPSQLSISAPPICSKMNIPKRCVCLLVRCLPKQFIKYVDKYDFFTPQGLYIGLLFMISNPLLCIIL